MMGASLLRALVALVPACLLLSGSILLVSKGKTLASILQLIGAAGLVIVALVHGFEALQLFPWMGWGLERSAGHYLDLSAAIVGLVLFPLGSLLHAARRR